MTVQELINELDKIDDKETKVYQGETVMSEYLEWEVQGYYIEENDKGEKVVYFG